MAEKRLNEDLQAVEVALQSVRLGPLGVERDRLMFEAGRASTRRARPGRLLWPLVSMAVVAVAFIVGRKAAPPAEPLVLVQTVYLVEEDEPAGAVATGATLCPGRQPRDDGPASDYGTLSRLMAQGGVEAIPSPALVLPADGAKQLRTTVRGPRILEGQAG